MEENHISDASSLDQHIKRKYKLMRVVSGTYKSYPTIKREIFIVKPLQEELIDQKLQKDINYKNLINRLLSNSNPRFNGLQKKIQNKRTALEKKKFLKITSQIFFKRLMT